MSNNWYSIQAKGTNAEIVIYDEIGAWGVSAKSFMEELKALGGITDITLRLNSPGGSVFDGTAIYTQLKQHEAQVTVFVDGLAASMASVIAMAGDLVVMPENAMMMIHNPWTMAIGDAEELRNNADVLEKIKKAMISAYTQKTGLSEEEVSAIMDAETWYTGAEAVELGFADEHHESLDIAACVKGFDLTKFQNSPFSTKSAVAGNQPKVKEQIMPENNPTKTVDPQAAVNDAVKAALAAEQERKKDIVAAFGDFAGDHQELLQACLMDDEVTLADAQAKLLKAMGQNEKPVASATVVAGESGSERFIKDAVDSLLARSGVGTVDSSNPLRGLKLEALARRSLALGGINSDGQDNRRIVAQAFTQTQSDFPIILENTMHKVLQNAYATQEDTWSRFCKIGSVSDFRDHNRYRTGSFGNLDSLSEAGEFKNKAIPDGEKAKIAAGTKGNIVTITREAIINDDLGAFTDMAASLGRAARRTIEADVYKLLAENGGLGPKLLDGKTLFHTDHGNIGGGAAISVAALEAERVLMGTQKDVSGNDFLDLRPEILLLSMALGGQARVLNDSQYDPDSTNKLQKPNMVRGLYSDIVDSPRLTGTRRYSFANPNLAPVIEVAFLNGEQNPFLDSEEGFTVDGVRWKVRMDYGVGAIDYRGATTDAGA